MFVAHATTADPVCAIYAAMPQTHAMEFRGETISAFFRGINYGATIIFCIITNGRGTI